MKALTTVPFYYCVYGQCMCGCARERERERRVAGMHKVNDSHVLELGMSGTPAVSEYPDAHAAQCKAG